MGCAVKAIRRRLRGAKVRLAVAETAVGYANAAKQTAVAKQAERPGSHGYTSLSVRAVRAAVPTKERCRALPRAILVTLFMAAAAVPAPPDSGRLAGGDGYTTPTGQTCRPKDVGRVESLSFAIAP